MILSSKEARASILRSVADEVRSTGLSPRLAVVLVGNDPASESYVKNKEKAGSEAGVAVDLIRYGADVDEDVLLGRLDSLAHDPTVNGIIVQLPLPFHLDTEKILLAIPPEKDVDGFHAENLWKLLKPKSDGLESCTPVGVLRLLAYHGIPVAWKHMVIVGDGKTVGRPLAALAIRERATVTVCNALTANLPEITRMADIVVAAVGKPGLIRADMVRDGAVVIDVGISRVDGKIVGDADFDGIIKKASCSPTPGWVGPMTVAILMENTLRAAKMQKIPPVLA